MSASSVAQLLNQHYDHFMSAPQEITLLTQERPSIFDQEYQYYDSKSPAPSTNELMQGPAATTNTSAQSLSIPGFENLGPVNVGILFNEPSLILALALMIEMFVPLPKSFKLSGLEPIFVGLSRKVNRAGHSEKQRAFAGFFLPVLILSVLLFLVFTLDAISGFDNIIALIVLIWSLELKFPQDKAASVYKSLHGGNKEQAKSKLSELVLRETSMLSSMGISKAACEGAILRIFSGWFSVMVWFFIAGIEGAVLMQTLNVLSHAFNYKLKGNYHFGQTVFRMHQLMSAIPALVLMLFLFVSKNPVRHITCGKEGFNNFPAPISGLVLGAIGGALNISLGGPRYYQGEVMRLAKVGGEHNPDDQSILYAMRKIRMCGLLLLVVSILIDLNF